MRHQNKRKHTPIPLLALQMAIYNTFPTRQHKAALSNLRASLADAVYKASRPKARIRL